MAPGGMAPPNDKHYTIYVQMTSIIPGSSGGGGGGGGGGPLGTTVGPLGTTVVFVSCSRSTDRMLSMDEVLILSTPAASST